MPKYVEPHNPVGITLQALIEGELMDIKHGLGCLRAKKIARDIEKRIQPSDFLLLIDGTIFTKTWIPENDSSQVERAANTIHAAHEERVKANIERAQQRRLDALMIEIQKQEETERDQQARHFARSIDLELDIAEFEDFQRDLREWRRIYVQ